MKNFEPGSMSIVEKPSVRATGRRGLIVWLLEALYVSRSREARRVIRRYRHLLAEDIGDRPKIAASGPTRAKESTADADRANTLLRAIHRALEDA